MVVFGMGKDFLFKSILGRCVVQHSEIIPKLSLEVIFIEKITEFRLYKSFECIVARHGPHGPGCKPTLHIIRRKL